MSALNDYEHTETQVKRVVNLVAAVTVLAVVVLVTVVVVFAFDRSGDHFAPIESADTALIIDADGVTPTVDGVIGPAIVMTDDATVPFLFTITNTTDELVTATTAGVWIHEEHRCRTPDAGGPREYVPGTQQSAFNAPVFDCVRDAVDELAAEGVFESVWSTTGVIDPAPGEGVETTSANFTLVHPDSPILETP